MAEYKKADEIVKNMTEKFDKNYGDTTIKGIRDVFNMCVNCVNQTPTADVVEVKRGHWIEDDVCVYACSECGFIFTAVDDISEFEFCRCGAKMDGKGEEK